ncbi:MAG TPA: sensor domain-containing protein [Mycobacterium sp.]|nr:sensor domain-containing protein [Mycobacterium sp.]
MLVGCTRLVSGAAELPPTGTPGPMLPAGVDVEKIMLDSPRMRAIAGAGEEMTIIPSMDAKSPVDVDPLAATVPSECRFVYAETATFGTGFTQFHKITFQYPPRGALISEGAAAYPDPDTARRAFDVLVATVSGCADSSAGAMLVGEWDAGAGSLQTRTGRCGRDYRVKSAALLEVTFCGFPQSVADLVMTNMAAGVPG